MDDFFNNAEKIFENRGFIKDDSNFIDTKKSILGGESLIQYRIQEAGNKILVIITHSKKNEFPEVKVGPESMIIKSKVIDKKETKTQYGVSTEMFESVQQITIPIPEYADWKKFQRSSTEIETTISFDRLKPTYKPEEEQEKPIKLEGKKI